MTEYEKTKVKDLAKGMSLEERMIVWDSFMEDEEFIKALEEKKYNSLEKYKRIKFNV